MIQAGATPDYPRPAPPPRLPVLLGLPALFLGTAAGALALDRLALAIANL
jgi:hypothetical protein